MSRAWLAFIFAFSVLLPGVAANSEIAGRFFPEKSRFLVGEPVYIVFEVVNKSSKDLVAYVPSGHLNCLGQATVQYEVIGATRAGFGPDGCCDWPATDVCDSFKVRLAPSQRYAERFLLNFWYHLDKPGTYQAHLMQDVLVKTPVPGVSTQREDFTEGSYRRFPISSEFRVTLVQGSPAALKQAFERVIRDLKSMDFLQLGWAQWAMIYLAPPSLETFVRNLAEIVQIVPYGHDQNTIKFYGVEGVDGLARLNTDSARRTLAYLAEHKGRSDAVKALGRTGDRSYLPLLIRLYRSPELANSSAEATGMLGGEVAMRFLISQLHSTSAEGRQHGAAGLGYVGEREAVHPLVEALYDPDKAVRHAAECALTRLTHRTSGYFRPCSPVPPPPPPPTSALPPPDTWARQQAWWKTNADHVTVYRWNDCGPAQPLD